MKVYSLENDALDKKIFTSYFLLISARGISTCRLFAPVQYEISQIEVYLINLRARFITKILDTFLHAESVGWLRNRLCKLSTDSSCPETRFLFQNYYFLEEYFVWKVTHSKDLQLGAYVLSSAGNVGYCHRKRTHILQREEILP